MRSLSTLALLFVVCLGAVPTRSQPAAAPVSLSPDSPVERQLAGAEAQSFLVACEAGQAVSVTVEQHDADVSAAVFDPAGVKLVEADFSYGVHGTELLFFVAAKSGAHRVEVVPVKKSAKAGGYRVALAPPRAADERDRREAAAHLKFYEGTLALGRQTKEANKEAVRLFEEAAAIWRELGNEAGVAQALHEKTEAHFNLGDRKAALAASLESLPLWEKTANRHRIAVTLFNIGTIQSGLGERQQALGFLQKALEASRELNDPKGEGEALLGMAIIHINLGEFRRSLELSERALPLVRAANHPSGIGRALNNLGVNHNYLGEPDRAAEYYRQALPYFKETGELNFTAGTYLNLADILSETGDLDGAFDYLQQALDIRRKTGNRFFEASTLRELGELHRSVGDYDKAIQLETEALNIAKAISRPDVQMNALGALGSAYAERGEYQKANENYRAALELARTLKDENAVATHLNKLGLNELKTGHYDAALESCELARTLFGKTGDAGGEALTLRCAGQAHHRKGHAAKALEIYRQVLDIARRTRSQQTEATAQHLIALAERDSGNLVAALAAAESAVRISESKRASLSRNDLRTSYFAGNKNFYDLYVEILLRLGEQTGRAEYVARALEVSEQSRARTLVDVLNQAGANVREGADAELLKREREVAHRLSAKAERQTRLIASGKASPEELDRLARELSDLTAERERLSAQVVKTSPRYAALTRPKPLKAEEVRALLGDDTVLLEYSLGEERSTLWLVTGAEVSSHRLPAREEIEAAARRYYNSLTARNRRPDEGADAQADAELNAAARALGDLLLKPVADKLGARRVAVVAEGAMQYVPFASLPKGTNARPLVETNEVVNLPSATALAVLRGELSRRKRAPKSIAVFADPVFNAADPRVKSAQGAPKETAKNESLQRSFEEAAGGDDGLKSIPRLPFSRREAQAILSSVPEGDALKAFDFAASAALARGAELADYRIVHFATHGLLNSRNPELSGLVLSLVDEGGAAQNGFLRLSDIYNLRLGADLVVLSACQTALGRDVRGEGLVGLTRGFMYAGAPRVVASLWKVDDAGTAELMRRFYDGVLKRGLRPAAALREAQVGMSRHERWRSPYYWAAFTIQGEWK